MRKLKIIYPLTNRKNSGTNSWVNYDLKNVKIENVSDKKYNFIISE